MRFFILFLVACYLWLASILTTGRPPIEVWPTNTPTPARIIVPVPPLPARERFLSDHYHRKS